MLPEMEWAAAIEATVGRAGTGGGIFRLAGTGGGSLGGETGVVGNGCETAGLSINPTQCTNSNGTGLMISD